MTMMKTARIHEYGDTFVIRYEAVPRPRPAFGEVLVRVAATSFNPTEAALRAGMLQEFLPVDLPYALGWDVAGTVAEIGAGAEVIAMASPRSAEAVLRQGADQVIDYAEIRRSTAPTCTMEV
ncbi:alcohol dehydrogenase catalytic domain-containing protein [Streptomyces sp. NPDC053513]|uniref:alcohol dehydrogenase catalytic domain-containing protein n=1 Tax=unclassified Streptomyces TaxID=2593676 RepID=UPI0037D72EA0